MALTPGSRLGLYEILLPLGAGGMGEVYRARDTKLGRDVAIKILPASVAAQPDRLARFEREARLLASLNHPNIGAIYGVEESAGVIALVLELVEGETLAARIAGRAPSSDRAMPIAEALDIAGQIAGALDAAHERGIVHRDLKPANIVITPDGTVKVLDFGLAKAGGADGAGGEELTNSPTMIAPTLDGVLLGTAPYMSPEQARGKFVDKRTDIWAFGCVLYEMLTGRRAFGGETTSDTIAAILEREPEWTRLPRATPVSVSNLLHRCLEKDPKRRLRDIGDVSLDPQDPEANTRLLAGNISGLRRRRALSMVSWALVVGLAVAFGLEFRRAPRLYGDAISSASLERVTYDAGLTATPAVSGDGRLLAYASDRSGRSDLDIWVQQTAGGTQLRLTDDPADDQMPDFSHDGSKVVFRSERNGGGVYLVSALGGEQRLLASEGRRPRFSPDGSRIAYWTGLVRGGANGVSKTFVLPLSGGDPLQVVPTFDIARNPVWSPDGQSLLLVAKARQAVPGTTQFTEWWWVPLDGRAPVQTTTIDPTWGGGAYPGAWTPSGVVFSQGGDLWSLPVSAATGLTTGAPRRLTMGAQRYDDPATSRDGEIFFTALTEQRVIDRAPLENGPPPATLYADSRSDYGRATQTRDGTRIVFERGLTRTREIWMKDVRTGQQRMVLQLDDPRQVDAIVSPDGVRIAYSAKQIGYVVEAEGGVPRRICDACVFFGFLSDSRRLLLVATDRGRGIARVIDSASQATHDLLIADSVNLTRLHASPDDRWLSFQFGNKIFVVPLTPGRPPPRETWMQVDEPTTSGRPCGWSLDSRVLYVLLDLDGFRCLYGQRVDPATGRLIGTPASVRHFHDRNSQQGFGTGFGDAISSEGFLYEGIRVTGNVWRLLEPGRNAR
jgi:dipeptidyl aminopeptidase/acylaminoacyl peptidase